MHSFVRILYDSDHFPALSQQGSGECGTSRYAMVRHGTESGDLTTYNMSSNIEFKKKCQWCGAEFIARKSSTNYCSHRCSSLAYKERHRKLKVETYNATAQRKFGQLRYEDKSYLTPTQAAELLGIGRTSLYRYINSGKIKIVRFEGKTLIQKSDIQAMFDFLEVKENSTETAIEKKAITDFYTIAEIREKYKVSTAWIFKVIAEKKVPKTIQRGKGYYSKAHIDRIFSEKKPSPEITEWYTVTDIQRKYDMTLSAIYSLVSKIGIPKKKEAGQTFYSKYHFDVAKGAASKEDEQYISVAEAMEKYNVTRDQLYHYVKTYKITRIKCGKYVKLSAIELADIFTPRIEL